MDAKLGLHLLELFSWILCKEWQQFDGHSMDEIWVAQGCGFWGHGRSKKNLVVEARVKA